MCDFPCVGAFPEFLFHNHFLILMVAGFFIGIFAVVIGGAMFFAAPLLQILFPQLGFGQIVGNLKVDSFARSIGSTLSTFRKIDFLYDVRIGILAFAGTFVGASIISNLSERWMVVGLALAAMMVVYAPRLAQQVSQKTFHIASFLTGIYAGFFGAGIGLILIALIRLKYPADEKIAHVKIQARFVEFLLLFTAVIAHYSNGNLIASIWVPMAIGSFAGGIIGGLLLNKMGTLSGSIQKKILYFGVSFALLVALYRFIQSFAS